jgi:hypothetical protein
MALLCCVALNAKAAELPQAPSALVASAETAPPSAAALPATSAPEHPAPEGAVEAEIVSASLSLPPRSLLDYGDTSLVANALIAPAVVSMPQKYKSRKVMDGKFLAMIGLGTALTVVDYEMTLRCMARHICEEANPFLPTSRAGMYASNLPLNALLYYWSYKRRASGKRLWWVAPLVIIGSHAAGVGTNIPFVGK